jgi:hypothetical protein
VGYTIDMHESDFSEATAVIGRLTRLRPMNKHDMEECLKRAAECIRLAESANDPEMKIYLMKLASSWQAAAVEAVEGNLENA